MPCTVVLVCGPPASGKSELIRSLESRIPQCTTIIFDEMFSIEEQESAAHEDNGFKKLREKFLTVVRQILDSYAKEDPGDGTADCCASQTRHRIILEDNFYRRSMRYKYFQEARQRNLSFCTVFLTTPMEDCLRRNRKRAQSVPDTVIIDQFSKLEVPSCDSFWEKFSISKPAPTLEDIEALMEEAEKAPFISIDLEGQREDLEESRRRTSDSRAHQVELAFRKAVSDLIQRAPPAMKKGMYTQLYKFKSDAVGPCQTLGGADGAEMYAQILSCLERRLRESE
ncbi:L-seryl-tRNA(Sec) kinase [Galendromus occidentalis]|uniref:L-seryl-tRNA(Sec) kinase n=1 Tax=Galendromus occidentalis TaxID=34638 RepID=A0AAJ6VWH5_9ACAR|nr:L-seryl-tRNA(Sec) kinase [Galendromus occidentalis]